MVAVVADCLSETNEAMISLVKPRERRPNATITEPMAIIGRLLPHRDVDSSARTPMIGCTIRPDSGPATQTRDVCPLVRPSDSRYGVQYVISTPHVKVIPTEAHVNKAMRTVSELPFILGCPLQVDMMVVVFPARNVPSRLLIPRYSSKLGCPLREPPRGAVSTDSRLFRLAEGTRAGCDVGRVSIKLTAAAAGGCMMTTARWDTMQNERSIGLRNVAAVAQGRFRSEGCATDT